MLFLLVDCLCWSYWNFTNFTIHHSLSYPIGVCVAIIIKETIWSKWPSWSFLPKYKNCYARESNIIFVWTLRKKNVVYKRKRPKRKEKKRKELDFSNDHGLKEQRCAWPCIVRSFIYLILFCVHVCVCVCVHLFILIFILFAAATVTVNVEHHLIYSFNLAYIPYIVLVCQYTHILYGYRMLNLYEIRRSQQKWTMNFWIFQIEFENEKYYHNIEYTRNGPMNIEEWREKQQQHQQRRRRTHAHSFTHFGVHTISVVAEALENFKLPVRIMNNYKSFGIEY